MKSIVLLLALALMLPSMALAQVGGVTVSLSIDQEQFLPDEDLVVSVQVVNRSGQELDFGKTDDWITFSIQGESNLVVPKLGAIPAAEEFRLRSGQTGTREFNLTPYFGFREIGRYRVVATLKVPQWDKEVPSKPVFFSVMNGVPLPNLPDLQVGMPLVPGSLSAVPEVRKYVLQQATYQNEIKLYFRLTDGTGTKTFKVYPLGRMVSFGKPEALVDGFSNLHVLHQYDAKPFNYCVISPEGVLLVRQTYDYTTRPTLRIDSEGRVFVSGGARRFTRGDFPPQTAQTVPSGTNDVKQ